MLIVTVTLLVMLALAANSIWRGTGLDSGWGLLIGTILGTVFGGKEIAARLGHHAAAPAAPTGPAAPAAAADRPHDSPA